MKETVRRNWKIVGLANHGDHYTVMIEKANENGNLGYFDSGELPSSFGDFGLSRAERGILHRGLTAGGNDRRPS